MAILGGWSSQANERLGDVVIFDSRTNKSKKVVHADGRDALKFNALTNQSGRSELGSVTALVSDSNHKPCLVKFSKGDSSVKVVRANFSKK